MKSYTEERVNKPILKSINNMTEEIAALQEKITEAKATLRVRCKRCDKLAQVQDLVYIQTSHYVEPYGCTGGDYTVEGEGQYECPKCGHVNRLITMRKEISKLKYHFKEIVVT